MKGSPPPVTIGAKVWTGALPSRSLRFVAPSDMFI